MNTPTDEQLKPLVWSDAHGSGHKTQLEIIADTEFGRYRIRWDGSGAWCYFPASIEPEKFTTKNDAKAACEANYEHRAELHEAAARIDALEAENAALRVALAPFSVMASELFSDNWNASDNVFLLDRDNGGTITAGDFFTARAALTRYKEAVNDGRD